MRDRYCGQFDVSLEGREVSLCGWVHRRRDHGGVIFVDLRDRTGLVQVVFDPERPEVFAVAEALRGEFVLQVQGRVRRRPEGTDNPHLPTGEVEVVAVAVEVLNRSLPLPFQLDDPQVQEETRMRYRYLDLRRGRMQDALRLRARVNARLRSFMQRHGFLEVETPLLLRSTPEGARDYLVPSRLHPGDCYALPQSPQLLKQLLMMSGMDRYYQIARCFRDEDLRADRQPEFTQLDIEASFMPEEELLSLIEEMFVELFREEADVALSSPFPRLSYGEAQVRYGTDRPDLRNPLELTELTELMREVEFRVFAEAARGDDGRVAAVRLPGGGALPRREIDEYAEWITRFGAGGLAWIKINDPGAGRGGLQSPILKFLPDAVIGELLERTAAAAGDLLFFGAGPRATVNDSLAALRDRTGAERGLVQDGWKPVWIVDFPMFEYSAEEQRWGALHHPFTAPRGVGVEELERDPGGCRSRAYDLVLNGVELGGGSARIHEPEMQLAVLRLLGMSQEEAQERFGFLLEALRYGCPPHGGIAFGLDRLAAMLVGADSIREVIAFPKTQTGACPLTRAPAPVTARQLRELALRPAASSPETR